jgi:DNA-binding XRE family transcriptional regulator
VAVKDRVLTEDDVRFIYQALRDGESQVLLARDFDVTQQSISAINTGKAWAHVTGQVFVPTSKRKLTVDDVLAIDAGIRAGIKNQQLADEFDVSNQIISNIRRGRDWTWVTGRIPNRKRTRND